MPTMYEKGGEQVWGQYEGPSTKEQIHSITKLCVESNWSSIAPSKDYFSFSHFVIVEGLTLLWKVGTSFNISPLKLYHYFLTQSLTTKHEEIEHFFIMHINILHLVHL
jgi:hypothetical protein